MKKLYFLLFSVLLIIAQTGFGQTKLYSTNFGTTAVLPTGWTSSNTAEWSASISTSSGGQSPTPTFSGGAYVIFSNKTKNDVATLTNNNNISTVGFTNITVVWAEQKTNSYNGTVVFQWSPDGTTWNTASFTDMANASASWYFITTIALPSGAAGAANLEFRFQGTVPSASNGNFTIDDFSVFGTPVPTLTSSVSSLIGLNYVAGSGPSSPAQSFMVTAANLSPATGSITITAPVDYQVSTTSATASDFGGGATISYSNGALTNVPVWVRLKASLPAATYNETITIGGGTATAVNISASGTVSTATPAITVDQSNITQIASGGNIYQGSLNTQVADFHINVTTAQATFSTLMFNAGGTFATGEITNFHLYANSTPTFPGGPPVSNFVATGIAAGGTVTFSPGQTLVAGSDTYFWITADVAANAVATHTVSIPALANAAFTFAPLVTVAGTSAIGGPLNIATTNYYWNGASPQTAGTANVTANGGTGTWLTSGTWVQPASPGIAATWTNGFPAIFAGTAGTVTLAASESPASINFNTSGYILQTTTTPILLNAPITLGSNALTLSPNVNATSPADGALTTGSISGSAGASLTIDGALSSTSPGVASIIDLPNSAIISVPTTIASVGAGSFGYAGYVASASSGSQITGNIINNSALTTLIGGSKLASGLNSDITINGSISGSAGLTIGDDEAGGGKVNVTLNKVNSYSGTTTINAATSANVILGIDNALPLVPLTITEASTGNGGSLDLNGHNQTIGTLSSGAAASGTSSSITNNGGTNSTLTITQAADQTFTLPVKENTGTIAIVKTGSAALTLSSATNNFSGGITVSAGTLIFTVTQSLPNCPVSIGGSSATLSTTGVAANASLNFGALTLTDNATITLDNANVHQLNFDVSSGNTWASGKILTIRGWQGSFNGTTGIKGQLIVGGSATDLTTAQLAQIQFLDAGNNTYSAKMLSTGEIVPNANINPTLLITPATAITFSGQSPGTSSASQSFKLSGTNLSSAGSSITVTAPSTDFQVSNNNSTWGASTTIAYTAPTLSPSVPNVFVRFTPQSAGSKTGSVTTSGGGAALPPGVTVNGSGAYISKLSGNWSTPATWVGNTVPAGTVQSIIIQSGTAVTLDATDAAIASLVINAGGTLSLTNNTNSITTTSATILGDAADTGQLIIGSAAATKNLFVSTSLEIGNAGELTNNAGKASVLSVTNFKVDNGGVYIHNTGGTSSGGTTDFPGVSPAITLGSTSTVVITQWGTSAPALPAATYGNLIINVPGTGLGSSWGQSGNISTINGTFTVMNTGGAAFRFIKSGALSTVTIGGDLNITGGSLGTTNATVTTAYPVINIGGSVNVSGGTFDLDDGTSTGTVTLDVTGNVSVSGTGTIIRAGNSTSLAVVNFSNPSGGPHSFTSTPAGINSNKISWNVGDGTTINNILTLNSDFIMSSSSLLTVNNNNSVTCSADVTIDSALTLSGNSTLNINGHTLQLNLNSAVSGTGTLTGSPTSNLVISGPVSTINFTSGSAILKNLTLNSTPNYSTAATVGTALDITAGTTPGNVTINSGVLTSNGNLTIKSDAGGTASIGNSAGTISGNVTVERYIPANRAWRILSAPTDNNSQTIHNSWQAITWITAKSQAIQSSGDFDNIVTPSTSMQTYDPVNGWVDLTSTEIPISGNPLSAGAYSIYIRGNRNDEPTNTTSHAIVLSTTGNVYQGQQTINVPGGKYTLIGNPYASAIDFSGVTLNGVANTFYVWDPKLTSGKSLGVYQTFQFNSDPSLSWQTPHSNGSYGASNSRIESGNAFFVYNPTGSTGSVQMNESNKATGSFDVFRPAAPATLTSQLKANLYAVSAGTTTQVDANFEIYNASYSNGIDGGDAPKLSNDGENFGIIRNGYKLVIEQRQPITAADTIFYDMWNMQQQQYQLEFVPYNMAQPGLTGVLKDSYLNTSTQLDLADTTKVLFSIDDNAASADSNRFMVVFKPSSVVPVTFTSVSAVQQGAVINVGWKVAGETGIAKYIVQRSADGTGFINEDTVSATGNTGGAAVYNWIDANPLSIVGYYRIESISASGDIKYTWIVRVVTITITVNPDITIYPNPVTDGKVNVKFINQPAGNYTLQLVNETGQVVYTTTVSHSSGTAVYPIILPQVAEGVYRLKTITPSKVIYTQKLLTGKK